MEDTWAGRDLLVLDAVVSQLDDLSRPRAPNGRSPPVPTGRRQTAAALAPALASQWPVPGG
jgi:hypothetical protein